jgi:ABC-type lipoprotein release transport system permease subunit
MFAKTLILVLVCSLVAGFFPARVASGKNVSEVMRME